MRDGDIITGWRVAQLGAGPSVLVCGYTGRIARLDMEHTPSDSWRATGVDMAIPGGRLRPIASNYYDALNRLADMGPDLRFKNCKPRYFLRDLDHGTTRVQMCGILSVCRGAWAWQRNHWETT